MKLSNEELYLAETLADAIEDADDIERAMLARLRYKTVCSKSDIGEHGCNVTTAHNYCCDTCLQGELHKLWSVGVHTFGSCCGHGRKQAFIQVLGGDGDIEKMRELGYEKLPPEENGDGQNCYKPKTFLPTLAICEAAQGECALCKYLGNGCD